MPNFFKCENCGAEVTAKFLWSPRGCAKCVCKRCGERFKPGERFEAIVVRKLNAGSKEQFFAHVKNPACVESRAPF